MSASRNYWRAVRLTACTVATVATVTLVAARPVQVQPSVAPGQPSDSRSAAIPPACLICHDGALITQQRLTRAAWSREVDKMIRWGAAVPAAEKERAIDALSAAFGPARSGSGSESGSAAQRPSAATSTEAPDRVSRSCLSCHDRDLIAQQRLTRAGWTREIEKMIRWGAPVNAEEKAALAEDLAALYPAYPAYPASPASPAR